MTLEEYLKVKKCKKKREKRLKMLHNGVGRLLVGSDKEYRTGTERPERLPAPSCMVFLP